MGSRGNAARLLARSAAATGAMANSISKTPSAYVACDASYGLRDAEVNDEAACAAVVMLVCCSGAV
jgi:hypothetical protein